MTLSEQSGRETTGWDEVSARAWIEGGTNENAYLLPWRLAATVAAEDLQDDGATVLDVASGPGGFLGVSLEMLPAARGIWFDNFATMETEARDHLAAFGARVEYHIGDLIDLNTAAPAATVALLTCSRATHHLEGGLLEAFYRQALDLLRPGGWLANLDSVTAPEPWSTRIRTARRKLNPDSGERVPGHPRGYPHTLEEHLASISSAGFEDPFSPWRYGQHVLVMARKPD